MKTLAITNEHDLRVEVATLRKKELEQQIELGKRFNGSSAIFATVKSLFPKSSGKTFNGGLLHQNSLQFFTRLIIPLALNKIIFRRSNFFVRALAVLISKKIVGLKSVGAMMVKAQSLLIHRFTKTAYRKNRKITPVITPDSKLTRRNEQI